MASLLCFYSCSSSPSSLLYWWLSLFKIRADLGEAGPWTGPGSHVLEGGRAEILDGVAFRVLLRVSLTSFTEEREKHRRTCPCFSAFSGCQVSLSSDGIKQDIVSQKPCFWGQVQTIAHSKCSIILVSFFLGTVPKVPRTQDQKIYQELTQLKAEIGQ
jgi:hypothetical protein